MSNLSAIQDFFRDSTVFLTGATGVVGKLVLEKILRACPVKQIYVLIREKRGEKDLNKRLAQIFECPAFGPLKEKNPEYMKKVSVIGGDCMLPNLGLSEEDINILENQVNCVIHCAATIKFDEILSKATKINVRGTRDLLRIAKNMKNLKAFVHVSTAYSNSPRPEIDEVIYEPRIDGNKLITAVENLSDDLVSEMQARIVGDFPNTYVLTKNVTEDLIRQEGRGFPVCIVRPSIVVATAKEPVAGFIDNIYGASGMLLGCGAGVWRSFPIDTDRVLDFIPADYVINSIIAAAWYIGSRANSLEPKVFNCVGIENSKTLGYITSSFERVAREVGSVKSIWYPLCLPFANRYMYLLMAFLLHTIPGFIVDFVLKCMGRKPLLRDAYTKIHKLGDALSYFSCSEWYFYVNNLKQLQKHMSPKDLELFNFDMTKHNWEQYIVDYTKGIRVYLMKDPMETLIDGQKHFKKLMIIHYSTCVLLIVVMYYVAKIYFRFVFSLIFGNI